MCDCSCVSQRVFLFVFLWRMWKSLFSFLLLIQSILCDVYQSSIIGEPGLIRYDLEVTGGFLFSSSFLNFSWSFFSSLSFFLRSIRMCSTSCWWRLNKSKYLLIFWWRYRINFNLCCWFLFCYQRALKKWNLYSMFTIWWLGLSLSIL